MMNNYDSLSLGVCSYLKKWSGGSAGSEPAAGPIKKSASLRWLTAILFLFIGMSNYGQVLINPAGDGGFNNGATFAANGWTVANFATSSNKWEVGSAVTASPFSGRSAYISQDGGTTSTYDNVASTKVYFYRDVAIPAGSTYIPLSFTWLANGESTWDAIQVFAAPTSVTPVAGLHPGSGLTLLPSDLTGSTQMGNGLNLVTTPQTVNLMVPPSFAGQTLRLIFMWKSDTSGGTTPAGAIDNISLTATTDPAPVTTATAMGGLWSSPATWVGGVVPAIDANVTIPAGSIVTVDQAVLAGDLTIAGRLQWNGTSNAMQAASITINSGGVFLPYTTGLTGQAINVRGAFTNNGYANLAVATTALTFIGPGSGTLTGSGVYQGNGTSGIIRALLFLNTSSNSITTSQNIIASTGGIGAGSLNTNGKLTIDNTAQVYGQALNTQVASLAVTNMGTTAYSVAPTVFGATAVQWSAITAAANTLYVSGPNVYRSIAAAAMGTVAPTHTSGIVDNLLWIGTTGTLGTPFQFNSSVSVGTQVFYGDRLYVCTVAGIPSSTAPPVHTSGVVASGAASFLYVGTPAHATVNFDSATGTIRSLNLTNPGSGYSSAPSLAFTVGVLSGAGAGVAASVVYIQQVAGPANSLMQKSGVATISGGLNINSDQGTILVTANPQASSGVGAVSTTNGGVAYASAPTVGFAGPPALNLVVDPGSGYTTAPTVNVTGGTLISGTALTTSNFTIAVNNGTVQAVYLNTATTATYSVPPTIALSGGNATIAWPAGCWPTATATVGSNGQVTNFTVTNPGFGYAAAPTVGLTGGTPVTAATAPTSRLGLYNLTLNFFAPASSAVVSPDDVVIPDTRKLNNLSLAGNGNGLNLANDLTLYGTSPLTLTSSASTPGNILNLGGYNLNFTWNGYAGATGTISDTANTYIRNGSMSVTGRGGSSTFNFPFSGAGSASAGITWFAGNGTTAANGSSVTRVTVSDTAAPTNATVGTGYAIGTRAFRVSYGVIGTTGFTSSPNTGTGPTVTLRYNATDALTGSQNNLYVAEATALNGPWTRRSNAIGGALPLGTTGSLTTATAAPGPINASNNSLYAWAHSTPIVSSFAPTTLCAISGAFTITGTGLAGVTAVTIGGTAVTSFTVVSDTEITGFAGTGTTGVVALTEDGHIVSGTETITVNASPTTAPTVTPASASVAFGGMVNLTASGSQTTFNWYTTAAGGTPIFTGTTYTMGMCASMDLYVAQSNGTCDGPRVLVPITVVQPVVTASTPTFCGAGGNTVLTATSYSGATYAWTSTNPSAVVTGSTTTNTLNVSVTESSDFQLVITGPGSCTKTINTTVSVYPLPTATVTTSASGVCPGTTATINSGLTASNFTNTVIPHAPLVAPVTATTLCSGGNVIVTPDLSFDNPTDLDDSGWGARPIGFNFNFFGTTYSTINIGTNGTVIFGTPNAAMATALADFTFTTLPSTTEPFNMVAVLAMDNDLRDSGHPSVLLTPTGVAGAIKHWTEGVAPNRRFIVSYENVREYADTKVSTAQAIFYETTGVIEVHVTSSTNVDRNKLVGVNNGNGTVGVLAYASGTTATTNPQNPITTAFARRFTPPYNYTTTWTADEGEGPTVIASGTNIFTQTVAPTVTTVYTISYTNQTTGCTNALNSAQVEMVILGNTAPTGVNTLASVNPVCPGSTTALSTSYTGSPDGLTYQWQADSGSGYADISGATSATYTATPTGPTSYRLRIRSCGNVAGESYSTPVAVTLVNAVITSSTGATRCGTGPVSITAAGTGTEIVWYATNTSTTPLFVGSTYNIASVAATTTYYVATRTTTPTACTGVRVPVVVTITPAPAITLSSTSATICSGATTPNVTITSTVADYTTYTWSPATGVSGSVGTGWTFNPTATTTYTLTGSNVGPADCMRAITYVVTVNANAPAPSVTPSSATIACGSTTPVLLSVGTIFVNPTPPTLACINNINGQWSPGGAANFTPNCNGSTNSIGTSFTAEHTLVNITPNTLYTFASDNSADYTVITQTDGTTVLAAGAPGASVTWFSGTSGLTQIRFYTQNDVLEPCDEIDSSRIRTIVCNGNPTATFSPTAGLFTDAGGNTAYTGGAVAGVYALPTATTTYTAVANNAANCPSVPTSVTVTRGACSTELDLKLFIEGYVEGSAMRPVMNNQDGTSAMDMVENIVVELRDANAPHAMLHTTTAALKTNGTAVATFASAPTGSFYIAIKTKNAIQTWSAEPHVMASAPTSYDFTTSASKAYGDNQILMGPGMWAIYSGDINQDEAIDNSDGVDLTNDVDNSEFGIRITDLNGDGAVDNSDTPFFDNNTTNSIFSNHP